MSLEPLVEYLTIEAWETEAGKIGWKMRSNCNEKIDQNSLQQIISELNDYLLEEGDRENPVLVSIAFQHKGSVTTRWSKGIEFLSRTRFLWLKRKLYQAQWLIMGQRRFPSLLLAWWNLEWFFHKLGGRLKPATSSKPVAATPVAAPLPGMVSEQSEGLENGSVGAGVVVQLFPKGQSRD